MSSPPSSTLLLLSRARPRRSHRCEELQSQCSPNPSAMPLHEPHRGIKRLEEYYVRIVSTTVYNQRTRCCQGGTRGPYARGFDISDDVHAAHLETVLTAESPLAVHET
ncbi:hypothetical protein PYCCODRAFT_1115949 [Trametes coccinea BRFM310]|uniref:Uncharacterized protein n=1 Tax=Trametes coccinea (strain BRFM310) TaxID=1353009 RepID=A0A1Y2I906_TRAC3|nr:hypothetical protein PYCCODRAFT_1115949 [Trametes coccinea BRFM310]